MKRIVWFIAAFFAVLLVLLAVSSPRFGEKYGALGSVGQTLLGADYNQVPIVQCGGILITARHNISVVTRAAEYISILGSNTGVFLEIAQIAAEADSECARLADVLDLAVMRSSESMITIALAKNACRLETPEQQAAWQQLYDSMLAGAEYPSVEAALADRRAS